MLTITVESLEALATQVENDDVREHARLSRLCRAMTRILAARQPELFRRVATSITDEAGHCDNSYPPKEQAHRNGPRLLRIFAHDTIDVPTSSGFYHDWRREPSCRGCYIGRDAMFYGCDESGTGHFGQFAAHPGDCSLAIELDWMRIEPDLEDLRECEKVLRAALATYLQAGAA